ncbi:MAG: hypothetical protein M3548_21005 [Actinomycetota bacterium]|nr:hypothetical protein [Actinomycetota bacterium]
MGELLSVDELAAELRQAVAKLPTELLLQATTCFDEARTLLAAASHGTNRSEAPAAIQALDTVIAQVAQVNQTAIQV